MLCGCGVFWGLVWAFGPWLGGVVVCARGCCCGWLGVVLFGLVLCGRCGVVLASGALGLRLVLLLRGWVRWLVVASRLPLFALLLPRCVALGLGACLRGSCLTVLR